MYIFKGITIGAWSYFGELSAYLCSYHNLEITAVSLDDTMQVSF
jgi:hypothetical protein